MAMLNLPVVAAITPIANSMESPGSKGITTNPVSINTKKKELSKLTYCIVLLID